MRLVESVISVTDYTGKVDADFPSASKRNHLILKQVGGWRFNREMNEMQPMAPFV